MAVLPRGPRGWRLDSEAAICTAYHDWVILGWTRALSAITGVFYSGLVGEESELEAGSSKQ